jgi:nucleotide-binding universal stress UspA family protein
MREFKTILCPTDFSEGSYRALEYAVDFAKQSGGTLLLAHTIHVASGEMQEKGHVLKVDDMMQHVGVKLADARAKYTGDYPKCELVVDFGDPLVKLLEIANTRNADLIVICTHGGSALKHLVIGSVAERLVRHASCPVFVVHGA